MKNKKHHSVYFILYERISRRLKYFVSMRDKGITGIAVDNDEYAKRWRQHTMKHSILESWLRGESPNWRNAYHLKTDEIIKRNGSYKNK